MACKIVEALDKAHNLDKNALIAHLNFDETTTADEIVEVINWLNTKIALRKQNLSEKQLASKEDDMKRYTFVDNPDKYLSKRVTQILQKKYTREQSDAERAAFKKKYAVTAEGGTFVHDINQMIGEEIVSAKEARRSPDLSKIKARAISGINGFSITDVQFLDLTANIERIVKEAYGVQKTINDRKGTNGNVLFFIITTFLYILADNGSGVV